MIDKAEKDYLGGMKYKDLAEKYDVSINTVKSWVTRNGWAKLKKKGCTQNKKGAYKEKVQEDRKKSNKKAVENIDKESVEEVIKNNELTDQQQLFCIYYIEHFNATRAYQQAYDCSRDSARTNSSRLLTKDNVKLEIDKLTEECLQEKKIDSKLIAKRLFQKMLDIASAEITDFIEYGAVDVPLIDPATNKQKIDEEGNLAFYKKNYVNFKDGAEVDGTVLSEVSLGKDGAKVKLQDKMKAIQWLSDRIDLLPIAVKEKLQLERDKLGANEEGQESQDWSKAIIDNAKKRREKNERNK